MRAYTMKKITLSFWFVALSAAYVVYLYFAGPSETPIRTTPPAQQADIATSSPLPPPVQPIPPRVIFSDEGRDDDGENAGRYRNAVVPPLPKQTNNIPPASAPAPKSSSTPKAKPAGMYADGTYTGNQADAYYGTVQVRITVQNGRIATVSFLQYPNDRQTSQEINGQAMPILKSEAIQAQSANVDIVSGATDTSMAFQQSLANALAQAK